MIDPTAIPMYKPEEIEPKWQARWEADGIYHAEANTNKPKHYAYHVCLSLRDLHIGHWYAMTPSGMRAFQAHAGVQCFLPLWSRRFWLAGENAYQAQNSPQNLDLCQHRAHAQTTKIDGEQLRLAFRAHTADPDYYRWTQWWFRSSTNTIWHIKNVSG